MRMINAARGSAHQLDLFQVKLCSRCKVNPQRPKHRYCAGCHASNMREWRKSHPLVGEARVKANARSYARMYQVRGKLIPEACAVKGCNMPSQKHHEDYSKPLDVQWMCRKHHLQSHGQLRYLPA